MISPGMVVTEEYSCAYVVNICPRLNMVLRLGWIASVCLSGTERFHAGCWSVVVCCIGTWYVSYFCTGVTDSCYSGSGSFSMVVRPWSDGEINVDDGSCWSECMNTNLFTFINLYMACHYLGGTRFPSQTLIVVNEVRTAICNCGDTLPVNKLSNKATVLAWIEEIPKYIPGVIFLFHFSKDWSKAKGRANSYTLQKSGWQFLGL